MILFTFISKEVVRNNLFLKPKKKNPMYFYISFKNMMLFVPLLNCLVWTEIMKKQYACLLYQCNESLKQRKSNNFFSYSYVISATGNIKAVVVVEVLTIPLECIGDDVERAGSYKRLFVLCFVQFTNSRSLEINKSVKMG